MTRHDLKRLSNKLHKIRFDLERDVSRLVLGLQPELAEDLTATIYRLESIAGRIHSLGYKP